MEKIKELKDITASHDLVLGPPALLSLRLVGHRTESFQSSTVGWLDGQIKPFKETP